jgi:murein DD-endopeptidase MepM/ murein hydrolase activator NlpD
VIFAEWYGGFGQLVLIDHHDGVVTAYAHLTRFDVRAGTAVDRGDVIGAVGSTGASTGPHLHLEFRVSGQAQDPRRYLPAQRC